MTDLDDDGYPTADALGKIAAWNWRDARNLFHYMRSIWWAPDWGWHQQYDGHAAMHYEISTGGWSGNESILGALRENRMIWMLTFVSHRRGGHYHFSSERSER